MPIIIASDVVRISGPGSLSIGLVRGVQARERSTVPVDQIVANEG